MEDFVWFTRQLESTRQFAAWLRKQYNQAPINAFELLSGAPLGLQQET